MKVVVTGAAGFLGSKLAKLLLAAECPLAVSDLLLVDVQAPAACADPRARCLAAELGAPGAAAAAAAVIAADTDVVFHLAAVVSGQAEAELDLGLRSNFDATRALLERARRVNPRVRFVFTSTVGVFGGDLPAVLTDLTAPMPQTSYGTAKAMCELLVNEYSRRGLADGRVVRLPTVCVRSGTANAAVTSFASGIVREPLAGLESVCPVPEEQEIWVASPAVVVRNIIHAATLPVGALGPWRVVNLPGITTSVRAMVAALRRAAGGAADRVRFQRDDRIARMVASFPVRFDTSRALQLGFAVDASFEEIIRTYIRDELKGNIK